MSKRRKNWYLLAYDVCCPRRIRKLHRFLLAHGVPVQLSVFLLESSPGGIQHLIEQCQDLIAPDEDHLMVYQTDAPGTIWRYGVGDDLPVWQLGKLRRRHVAQAASSVKPMSVLRRITGKLLWKD